MLAALRAKAASRTLWAWVERHHVDAGIVLLMTMYITFEVMDWAMEFADTHYATEGMHIPAIIGAVLTPWGLMQAAMFKFYTDLKAKAPAEGE